MLSVPVFSCINIANYVLFANPLSAGCLKIARASMLGWTILACNLAVQLVTAVVAPAAKTFVTYASPARQCRSYERSSVLASLGVHCWLLRKCTPPQTIYYKVHDDVNRVLQSMMFPVRYRTSFVDWRIAVVQKEGASLTQHLFEPRSQCDVFTDVYLHRSDEKWQYVYDVSAALVSDRTSSLWSGSLVRLHSVSRCLVQKNLAVEKCACCVSQTNLYGRNNATILLPFYSFSALLTGLTATLPTISQ